MGEAITEATCMGIYSSRWAHPTIEVVTSMMAGEQQPRTSEGGDPPDSARVQDWPPKARHPYCLKGNKKSPPNEADIAKGGPPGGSSQEKEDKVQKTGHQLPEVQLKGEVYTHQGRLEGVFGTKKTLSALAFPDWENSNQEHCCVSGESL